MVVLRWFLCLPWFLFAVWMFIYSMPLSGIYSLMLLWVLMPLERQKTSWFTILFAPIFIWNVGFIEYGLKTIDLHCRVLGYSGTKSPPTFCSYRPDSFQKGGPALRIHPITATGSGASPLNATRFGAF